MLFRAHTQFTDTLECQINYITSFGFNGAMDTYTSWVPTYIPVQDHACSNKRFARKMQYYSIDSAQQERVVFQMNCAYWMIYIVFSVYH